MTRAIQYSLLKRGEQNILEESYVVEQKGKIKTKVIPFSNSVAWQHIEFNLTK